MANLQAMARCALGGGILAAAGLVAGCATQNGGTAGPTGVTVSDKARLTRSGFLSDYGQLKLVSWGDGIECWRDPNFDVKTYDKVLVSRIVVSLTPPKADGGDSTIDPSDLKTLTDYFHDSMVKALKPQMQVVEQPGVKAAAR